MAERYLEGRIAWITGGGSGMGRAIAIALAEAGSDVAIGSLMESERANVVSNQKVYLLAHEELEQAKAEIEERGVRAPRPRSSKSWMALRTVCCPQRKFWAIRGGRWPWELAKSIWARRRTKASEERRAASSSWRSCFESVRTKIGGFMSTTVPHHSRPVLKMH